MRAKCMYGRARTYRNPDSDTCRPTDSQPVDLLQPAGLSHAPLQLQHDNMPAGEQTITIIHAYLKRPP